MPKPRKHPVARKMERSRPGIAMPDVRGTFDVLIEAISQNLLSRLESGATSHLVVADKTPVVTSLSPMPGLRGFEENTPMPSSRNARNVRDSWHKDQFYGLVYVLRGEADLLLCRKVLTCRSGDFLFLLPQTWRNHGNASHWERNDIEKADNDLLWLFFHGDGVNVHLCKSRGHEHARSPVLLVPDTGFLNLLEFFGREALSPDASTSLSPLLWLIFERVLRKLEERRAIPSAQVERRIDTREHGLSIGERARNYVDANLGEKLTLAIVARAVHVSRTKLSQDFVEVTGETFGGYVLRRRIEEAQNLLTTTNIPIAHISWVTGFSNADYFSTVFRRQAGVTPTVYRAINER